MSARAFLKRRVVLTRLTISIVIFMAVSLAMTRLNTLMAQAYLACSHSWKSIEKTQCSNMVDCGPNVTCADSPSLPQCPDDEFPMNFKSTVRRKKVGLCSHYNPPTSCQYCPGMLWCIEYEVFQEGEAGKACIGECETHWFEGHVPDRCY